MLCTSDTTATIVILVGAGNYYNSDTNDFTGVAFDQQEAIRALQMLAAAPPSIEIIARPDPLMYKGYMTPEQYNKYLYLQLFKNKVKSINMKGKIYLDHLKTFRRYQRR